MKPESDMPPELAERLLSRLCKQDLIEEILGDLHEHYEESEGKPRWKRVVNYWFHVFHFLRPFAIKNLGGDYRLNQYGLFRNYFKTSFRNLMKNPLGSFINIFGLSAAISICLVAYAFMEWERNRDQFHENKHKVYLATAFINKEGIDVEYGITPGPLGKMLKEDFPSVSKMCRIEDRNVVVKYEGRMFHEQVRYTDAAFLEMFTFPLKWGSPKSLADINSVILSEEASIRYFGYENPVGQDIRIIFEPGHKKTFRVAGVAEAFPKAHYIEFDFLIHFENLKTSDKNYEPTDWSQFINATLIQVDKPTDIDVIKLGTGKYRDLHNEVQQAGKISTFGFEPLAGLNQKSHDIIGDISFEFPPEKYVLPILGLLVLVVACLNYINIAIASAAKRLKEIGLRKAIGANKRMVLVQFLAENMMITFFALVIGVILGATITIPLFDKWFEFGQALELAGSSLWVILPAILILTGLISGLYPALYISGFRVTNIFNGSVRFGKRNLLNKISLFVQLVLTCVCISSGLAVLQNVNHIYDQNWGYNRDDVVYVRTYNAATFDQFHTMLEQDPDVLSISGTRHHMGKGSASVNVNSRDGNPHEVRLLSVGKNYLKTMELNLISGRFFEHGLLRDKESVVVNERFLELIDMEQALGGSLQLDSMKYRLIGVVEDFHFSDFDTEIQPVVLTLAGQEDYEYLAARVRAGSQHQVHDVLRKEWSTLFPDMPFSGGFQHEVFADYNKGAMSGARVILAVAVIATILVCLGLYGLLTFNLAGRIKEFSIRKVMGAQLRNIATTIAKPYVWLFMSALIIGIPLSLLVSNSFLDLLYSYYLPMSFAGVTLPAMLVTLVLIVVIIGQINRISRSNPVNDLKAE